MTRGSLSLWFFLFLMALLPLIDRNPTIEEVRFLRELLSCFTSGIGRGPQFKMGKKIVKPANGDQVAEALGVYFDCEHKQDKKACDIFVDGTGQEVKITNENPFSTSKTVHHGRVIVELYTASKQAWSWIADTYGSTHADCQERRIPASFVGEYALAYYAYRQEALSKKAGLDKARSGLLVMCYWCDLLGIANRIFRYRFADVPKPGELSWSFDGEKVRGVDAQGGVVVDYYCDSNGQVKWYPKVEDATFSTETFWLDIHQGCTLRELHARYYHPKH